MSDFKFSCPACGQHIVCDTSNAGMTIACPVCQTALVVPQPPAAAPAPAAPPGLSIAASQARHTASEASHSAAMMSRSYAQPQATGPAGPQKTSGLAIASLVCSLTFCLGFIPGIICGHLARRTMRRDPSLKGAGLATAGLIIGYFTLAFTIFSLLYGVSSVTAIFKSPEFKKALEDAKKQQEIQAAQAAAKPNSPAKDSHALPASDDSLWNLNLTTASFPDRPAAGKIHGQDFTVESAVAQNGNIILRQGQNSRPDLQVIIFTFLKKGQTLPGKTYDLSPANADLSQGAMPHVHLGWKEEGSATNKTKIFAKGFALKLEIGPVNADGQAPAKIYLCLPDSDKSYVAGAFSLELKKSAAPPKSKKKPAAN